MRSSNEPTPIPPPYEPPMYDPIRRDLASELPYEPMPELTTDLRRSGSGIGVVLGGGDSIDELGWWWVDEAERVDVGNGYGCWLSEEPVDEEEDDSWDAGALVRVIGTGDGIRGGRGERGGGRESEREGGGDGSRASRGGARGTENGGRGGTTEAET